jgi:hypothetical protein
MRCAAEIGRTRDYPQLTLNLGQFSVPPDIVRNLPCDSSKPRHSCRLYCLILWYWYRNPSDIASVVLETFGAGIEVV